MMLGGLLILGLVAYLVWDSAQRKREVPAEQKSQALEILRERYAKGEISREEFEEKRKMLEAS